MCARIVGAKVHRFNLTSWSLGPIFFSNLTPSFSGIIRNWYCQTPLNLSLPLRNLQVHRVRIVGHRQQKLRPQTKRYSEVSHPRSDRRIFKVFTVRYDFLSNLSSKMKSKF